MQGSRQTKITLVLVLIGVVLSLVAVATDVPDWAIVVLFIAAALATYFWWPGEPPKD